MPIDPVCRRHVEIPDAAASFDFQSWTFYFCSVECWKRFEKDPELYMHGFSDRDQIAG